MTNKSKEKPSDRRAGKRKDRNIQRQEHTANLRNLSGQEGKNQPNCHEHGRQLRSGFLTLYFLRCKPRSKS